MHHIVYQTTCLINQKIYIGVRSTTDLNDGYLGSGTLLQKAIEKYGRENFEREILHFCDSKEQAYELEKQIVNEEFIKREDIYNLKLGGTGGCYFRSEETKQKISTSMKQLPPRPEEWRINNGKANKGKIKSKETIEKYKQNRANWTEEQKKNLSKKMSLAKVGKSHNQTEETKQKISKALKGNKNNEGKKRSEETKRKISEALKGNKNNEGNKHSEETKQKISKTKKDKRINN